MSLPKIIKVTLLFLIVLAVCAAASAQTSKKPSRVGKTGNLQKSKSAARKQKKDNAPRLGTIRDYPATGLMTGCANLYFEFADQILTAPVDYVFLSRSGGENAWMNLDGRDTRLALLKTTIWHKSDESFRRSRYDYRAGATLISVFIEPRVSAEDYTLEMKIVLRRGRVVRVVKALGSSDC